MAKKLFVGGLSWDTSDVGLKEAFERFGEISEAKVITDRDTGRSRGFGFVSFNDDDAATRAMDEMNGTELDGRNIRVNEAHDRPRDGGGGRFGRRRSFGRRRCAGTRGRLCVGRLGLHHLIHSGR